MEIELPWEHKCLQEGTHLMLGLDDTLTCSKCGQAWRVKTIFIPSDRKEGIDGAPNGNTV